MASAITEVVTKEIKDHEKNCEIRKVKIIPMGILITIFLVIATGFCGGFLYLNSADARITEKQASTDCKQVEYQTVQKNLIKNVEEIKADVKTLLKEQRKDQ